jgi:hypothetical protein
MALKKCVEFGTQPITALGRDGVKVEKRQHIVTSCWRIELHGSCGVLTDLRSVEIESAQRSRTRHMVFLRRTATEFSPRGRCS